jgi:hypothetical protein
MCAACARLSHRFRDRCSLDPTTLPDGERWVCRPFQVSASMTHPGVCQKFSAALPRPPVGLSFVEMAQNIREKKIGESGIE